MYSLLLKIENSLSHINIIPFSGVIEVIMNNYILKVENLQKSYDKRKKKFKAVNDVSFEIKRGEIVGLIGESGCGKTTIGKIITNLIEADEGNVIFFGKNISKLSKKELRPIRSKIQMIFQNPSSALNPQMRINRILKEALFSINITKKEEQQNIINQYITKVGLTKAYLSRYPHELSGGQKQRICILLALLTNPSLIIADEVVSALDLSVQAQILNLLKSIQKELSLSMLFISHNLNIIYYMSDRIMVMYMGEIVESGDCEEIYKDCRHPYTKLLLSSVLSLDDSQKIEDEMDLDYNNSKKNNNSCVFYDRCPRSMPVCNEKKPENIVINGNHTIKCHFGRDV